MKRCLYEIFFNPEYLFAEFLRCLKATYKIMIIGSHLGMIFFTKLYRWLGNLTQERNYSEIPLGVDIVSILQLMWGFVGLEEW